MKHLSKLAASSRSHSRILTGVACLLLSAVSSYAQPAVPSKPSGVATSTAPATTEWEYKVENANISNRSLEVLFNQRGAEGWELVWVSNNGVAIFKRPKKK